MTAWYLSGGIDAANCIAAYEPIGAANYAASKVNLANPGTYDAADHTTYPTWDATNGWIFPGTGEAMLRTGLTIAGNTWTTIIRLVTIGAGGGGYGQGLCGNAALWQIIPAYTVGTHVGFKNGSTTLELPSQPDYGARVLALANTNAYFNGSDIGDVATGTLGEGGLAIGNRDTASINRCLDGTVQAVAVYDTTLSAAQIDALTTAMNALPVAATVIPVFMNQYRQRRN